MSTKHTAPPWWLFERKDEIGRPEVCIATGPRDRPERMIAILCGLAREDFEANARLLVSAPALHAATEAAQALLDALDRTEAFDYADDARIRHWADVLAKRLRAALGGAQGPEDAR